MNSPARKATSKKSIITANYITPITPAQALADCEKAMKEFDENLAKVDKSLAELEKMLQKRKESKTIIDKIFDWFDK